MCVSEALASWTRFEFEKGNIIKIGGMHQARLTSASTAARRPSQPMLTADRGGHVTIAALPSASRSNSTAQQRILADHEARVRVIEARMPRGEPAGRN